MSVYRQMPLQDEPKRSAKPPWWRRLLCGMGRHDVIENGWVDAHVLDGVISYQARFEHRCGHVTIDPKFATFPQVDSNVAANLFEGVGFNKAVECGLIKVTVWEAPTLTPFATSVRSCTVCGAGLALVDFGNTVLCTGCGARTAWDK